MRWIKKINKQNYINLYARWLSQLKHDTSQFVAFTDKPFLRTDDDIKIFAYYLTQFHPIPENDSAHGKGFTEWTNVASCAPYFAGHYQPKIPYDLGFYNLTDINVMRRQAEIAQAYGLYGFCFYYYWFSGKKVLEKPLYNFLNSDIDMHFHLCWANENWSKLWDGGNKEIILEQKISPDDAEKFWADLLPFVQDNRYEKIVNKPLLMIYRPEVFEQNQLTDFMKKIEFFAKQVGFDGIFWMASNAMGFNQPMQLGFQGIIEFPPHVLFSKCDSVYKNKISKTVNFNVLNLNKYLKQKQHMNTPDYTLFKACFPSWDNCPRKAYSHGTCFDMTYEDFKLWLTDILQWTKQNNKKNNQYVYINAWNEWAEGAILEPTTRYGYKALDIMKQCLEEARTKNIS